MDECEHNWQLARSKQSRGSRDIHEPGRFFGHRVKESIDQFQRVDEYYCTRCLKDHIVQRRAIRNYPEWWSMTIDTDWHRFTLFYEYEERELAVRTDDGKVRVL